MIAEFVTTMPQHAKSKCRGLVIETSSGHIFGALHDIW